MDESPLEAVNFGNSIAVKDEETDYTTAKLNWHKLMDEKQSINNSHVEEAIPFIKKLNDRNSLFSPGADIKPGIIMTHKNASPSSAPERRAHYTLSSPLHFKPFIRKKVRQEEIVFNRECKKLEKVWINRGLPVDTETVRSAACKDAFDLKDLSDSLPSTSTCVNKPSIIAGMERTPKSGIPSRILLRSRARNFTHSCRATITRLPVSETIPSACNSQMATIRKNKLASLIKEERLARVMGFARYHQKHFFPRLYSRKPKCDEQKEPSEGDSFSSKVENFLSKMIIRHQELSPNPRVSTSEQPNFGSEFATMSIDDKQDEKKKETQDSDDENHLPSPVPLPPFMTNYVPKSELPSSWDPNKNWSVMFDHMSQKFNQVVQEIADLPTIGPLNSPMKEGENASKMDGFWTIEKELAKVRLTALKHMREQNKAKALDCYRKIFDGEENRSERENPSLEGTLRVLYRKFSNVPKVESSSQTERISTEKMKIKQNIKDMKESIKNVRTFHFPFSRRHPVVKSDKVVPD